MILLKRETKSGEQATEQANEKNKNKNKSINRENKEWVMGLRVTDRARD